ncbi:MAG: CDP-glycerol glycerophosphotransferase family protein [Chloroflexi bacterium]|nr:CDP-glycerol glycerophosphotransferase family protein [Chloroflexota bacterium]
MNAFVAARALLVRLGFAAGHILPVRSRVVLASAHGDRIGGNLAWIRDGIRRELPGVRIVQLTFWPGGQRTYVRAALHALTSGFHLATARLFVVDDYFFPMYVARPRAGTTYVQVWHACGAFKKFAYSVIDKQFGADAAQVQAIPIHSTYDLCLVSAARFTPAFAEAFRLPPERFTSALGIPRTDLFLDHDRMAAAATAVRGRYAIPAGRRVILYAPTYRASRMTNARDPLDLDIALLEAVLGSDHVLLLRSHPFVRERSRLPSSTPFAIDVSDHPDINELMLVSDVLVTDYSSAIYEFALLGRPMAFFAPDHATYESERGFYFDYMSGVPGPVFTSTDELAGWLRAGSFDTERVRRFAAESFDVMDGLATARFVDAVVRPALDPVGGASIR